MTRSFRVLTTIAGCLLVASCGCSVQTVHPLSECGEIVHDDTVLGEWEELIPELGTFSARVTITKDNSGRYRLDAINSDEPSSLVGCIVVLGEDRFFELHDEYSNDQTKGAYSTGIGTHLFARCKIEKNQLTIWPPNVEFFKDAIAAGELSGLVQRRDFITSRVVVTSRADELRDFIASNSKVAFGEPTVFRRAESKAVSSAPENRQTLGGVKSPAKNNSNS